MNATRSLVNVVMMASAHSAFDTRIFHKEAKTLIKAGFNVKIIVPHTADISRDQIQIIAVTPPKNGTEKLLITPIKILIKALMQPKNSIFHIHDSELLLIAFFLKFLGKKVLYDAHEDTPLQMMYQHWIPSLLRKSVSIFYYILEKNAGKFFDAIIVAEPVLLKYYPQNKTILLRNFPILEEFNQLPFIPYKSRKDQLVYIGLLSKPRGIFEMAEGVKLSKKEISFDFVIGGKFAPPNLQKNYLDENDANFLSWLSLEVLISVLYQSKIGIIIPLPIERYLTNYPVKMFEYMAAGLPVIGSKHGISSEFIKECNGGILVDPLDPAEISQAIKWLFKNPAEAEEMGKRGRELIFAKYNWEAESEKLISLYQKIFFNDKI